MPIYEYRCKDCGQVNDYLVKNTNKIELKCPDCGSEQLDKQISVPGGLITKNDISMPEMPCGGGQCPSSMPGPICGTGGCHQH